VITRRTVTGGKRFEELNIKLVPRVYLDWSGMTKSDKDPQQHWPVDLHTFDYDSPAFQDRLKRLIEKLGQAWDEDPRIFAVQMGLIGQWGEHHSPTPTTAQRRLLAEAFQKAFKNKPVLVRHTDAEFMEAGFGIYYDTLGYIGREPPDGPKDQFPWQATQVHREIWKRAPIEGEVEYNWQAQRESANPKDTFGRYRFTFRVRGTPGQAVEFELADDWRGVSKEATIPLTEEWQEHHIEFEIKTTFKDKTTLRFNLPENVKGTFDLADARLRRTTDKP